MKKTVSIGIDTSNYKTSVAAVDEGGEILFNHQQFLEVKKGERGLRQSEALFQHVQNLPAVLEKLLADHDLRERIGAVSASTKPRPVDGSYMPVFTAGTGYGRALAAALNVPFYSWSHQEGHIEAIRYYSELRDVTPLICFHFSGGTTEALLVKEDLKFEIVGGSKDLAYGQVLDRIGVAMGLDFPCGEAMDKIAMTSIGHPHIFTPIQVKDGYVNLSGIETQGQRALGKYAQTALLDDLFEKLSASIVRMSLQLSEKYQIRNFIYAGGVSCSQYMRNFLVEHLFKDLNIVFGKSELSSDNAIGVGILGGKNVWR
ncbi:MAG: O-sialoglycoprotein endopeptidase [Firmicutes bacterium]|nr:O-sialoglycoprotein endopeptidase [Bacillota bacterium]